MERERGGDRKAKEYTNKKEKQMKDRNGEREREREGDRKENEYAKKKNG